MALCLFPFSIWDKVFKNEPSNLLKKFQTINLKVKFLKGIVSLKLI